MEVLRVSSTELHSSTEKVSAYLPLEGALSSWEKLIQKGTCLPASGGTPFLIDTVCE